MILWDIVKCYLSTSYDRRSKYSGPFPNLRPSLDTNQIKAFEDFDEDVVNLLKEFMQRKYCICSGYKKFTFKEI